MSKYTHEQLVRLTARASNTEEQTLENARSMVLTALANYEDFIPSSRYTVFGQGSYINNTNVRQNSDMDINVCYTNYFFFEIPSGTTIEQHGFPLTEDTYTYAEFKELVRKALVKKFCSGNVIHKNKCFHIKDNTYHSEIDVVPTISYRKYGYGTDYAEGVWYKALDGTTVINYPKVHLANGRTKNDNTRRRYKKLVRIVKNLANEMYDTRYYRNENVTSFLLECLTYNFPNNYFQTQDNDYDWNDMLKSYIRYFWNRTKEDRSEWQSWTEVSEQLPLMYDHKWTRSDVHIFMLKLWNYLGYDQD